MENTISKIENHKLVKSSVELTTLLKRLRKEYEKEKKLTGKYTDMISLMSDGMDYSEAKKHVKY